MPLDSSLSSLREQVRTLLPRAHVPFSDTPVAAGLLLEDGTWTPGVRVESASYPLTLPALINAYTTVVAARRASEVVAFVLSRPFRPEESLYVGELPHGPFEPYADDVWLRARKGENEPLPSVTTRLSPEVAPPVNTPDDGIEAARRIAEAAYVPSSDYPVGALLELEDNSYLPGVNVEHPDWARILCAERNALGTALSYATASPKRLFLSCPKDPEGTPCGACRQLLAELAPEVTLWLDRHDAPPEKTTISALLPGSFRGSALLETS